VIVTDHHLPDSNFAYSAAAVLNPNRKDCSSEFKSYSGGGMALLFCIGIAKALKMESDYITKDLFVLATISTIADMVPLVGDNRKIIKFGLNNLKSSGITGLSMLMDKVYMSGPEEVSARDVSFRIAPLINAAGKFGFAESAITVLTSEDRFSINNAIKNLLSISSKRRELVSAAISALSTQVKEQKGNKKNFIFLVGDHRSAINGLIATRVMEEVGVPTFVASTEEENILKISGRSFGSVDLSRVISDTKGQHLGGGGHAFAAGVKIQKEKQLEFLSAVEESVSAQIESFKEFKKYWEIDGQIGCTQINSSIINALKLVSPFGKGNEPPLFILKNAEIKKDILGTKLNHYLICPYGKLKVNFATVDMSADETLGGSDILVELNFSASDPFLLVKDIKKHQ
jgi:single-stranded-DNA-specific exonuclease